MQNFNKVLVVIPARGGSKRIRNKNIKQICGQPMIYWPLMELQKFCNAENILVSTDSKLIKSTVERKGLKVPFIRPKNLSDDYTGTVPVVTHALSWYEEYIKRVDYVLTVYPTAVLLREKDIHSAMIKLRNDKSCDTVMSATNFSFPIQRAVFENTDGYAEMLEPQHYSTRSQDLVDAKHDAGQFYLSRVAVIREGRVLTNTKVKLQLLHRNDIVDIDTIEDLEIAEEKLNLRKLSRFESGWTF